MISSEQVRGARAMLRWEQKNLAEASGVSLATIKRLEMQPGSIMANRPTVEALKRALESAGVEFIAENGGGAGVRLRKQGADVGTIAAGDLNASNDE
jgi:transcriptional regulator with XRE-family HTH domain